MYAKNKLKVRTRRQVQEAENKHFELLWYQRQLQCVEEEKEHPFDEESKIPLSGISDMERIEATYPPEELKPMTHYDLGMLEGKLSALRWVLGMQWDYLDT
jgi:hypothetical protein